jgi:hypothetical protein
MLKNFKGPLKPKGEFKTFLISGVICPNQGLLIEIPVIHFYSGETVPFDLKKN